MRSSGSGGAVPSGSPPATSSLLFHTVWVNTCARTRRRRRCRRMVPMPVHVYTAHCDWYRGRDVLDLTRLTVRSRAFLCGNITECISPRAVEQRAQEQYLACLRTSYRTHRSMWQALLAGSRIVVVCTCPPSRRTCRRYVLADVFGKLGASLGGELRDALPPLPLTRTSRRSS